MGAFLRFNYYLCSVRIPMKSIINMNTKHFKPLKALIFAAALLLQGQASVFAANTAKRIVDLKTNYEAMPVGVEGNVDFSWRMEAAGAYKARQTAFRILLAESESALGKENLVYDSQKKAGSNSVCHQLAGLSLKPCTKYFWKVQVWDEKGRMTESAPSWFETSLMQSGWSGAQWVGSPKEIFSIYFVNFVIDYDMAVEKGGQGATFVFGAKDKDNYCALEYSLRQKQVPVLTGRRKAWAKEETPQIVLFHVADGRKTVDATVDVSGIIAKENINDKHHVQLTNFPNGQEFYELSVKFDGKPLKLTAKEPVLRISDKYWDAKWYKRYRIYRIGINHEHGECAAISNLKIRDKDTNTLLYRSDKLYLADDGSHTDGLEIWDASEGVSAPILRKSFMINKNIKRARLYTTARGIYEMAVNGKQVGEDFLNPGWTDYRKRFMYNTFDVTALLAKGKNTVAATLGNGWWQGRRFESFSWYKPYGYSLSLLGKLVVEFEDGTIQTVVTDGSWLYSNDGPVVRNDLYDGETYDARKEIPDWAKGSLDESKWKSVKVFDAPDESVKITPYIGQPVRTDTICTAQSVTEPLKGVYIYDMGQNMVGVPHLKLFGKAGQMITVRYAEMKYPDRIPTAPIEPYTIEDYQQNKGLLYVENYRTAVSTDNYICKGGTAGETFEPHFTCHGFRYIEISGADAAPALGDVKVKVLNSLQDKRTCDFETSDSLLNKLFSNIQWGERGNFLSIPTDCPQRDERAGWTGDAELFARTATYNRNVNPFYRRWLTSMRDDQCDNGNFRDVVPDVTFSGHFGWADAGVIVPWQVFQQYGDKSVLETNYDAMKRYIDYIEKLAPGYIQGFGAYGDWVALVGTRSDLTNTCFAAYDVQLMSKVAEFLGKTADKERFDKLFLNIKKAFNKRFVSADGHVVTPTGTPLYYSPMGEPSKEVASAPTPIKSQTAYIIPLYMNMIEDSVKARSASFLAALVRENDYKLNTGFIGTPYLTVVLSDYGYDDVAYKLIQQQEYPSWLYPVLQGATTMWERWDSYTLKNGFGPVGMNSFNHYAYGAVQEWLVAYAAGIQRDDSKPGYSHFILQPRVGGKIDHIKCTYKTVYGAVKSAWKSDNAQGAKNEGADKFGYVYSVTVPANSSATLLLPVGNKAFKVLEGKAGILNNQSNGKEIKVELASGSYQFKVK